MNKESNKENINRKDKDNEIERQKIIDAGGKEKYNDNGNKRRDSNILIDSEH